MKVRSRLEAFLLLIVISLVAGCATNHSFVMPTRDIRQYKTAYVEIISPDQFNLGPAIVYELGDMGFQVVNKPTPTNPSPTDMRVGYSYTTGWDLSKYLYSFHIVFLDAQTDAIIASIAYQLTGNWVRSDARITAAFNGFRKKLGFPESRRSEDP